MNAREELGKLIAEWLVEYSYRTSETAPSDGYGQIDTTKAGEYLAEKFDYVSVDINQETINKGWKPHSLITIATLRVRHQLETRVDKFPGVE